MTAGSEPDIFDRMVDFGYHHDVFFDRSSPNYSPLPPTPPAAARYDCGERCPCPCCTSQGRYAASPACRFWRSDCCGCAGTRQWPDFSQPGHPRRDCNLCLAEWRTDISFFRDALRNPAAVARQLREKAARQRHPNQRGLAT